MGLKLNPITAQFDLTGSGGGSSYIDGEVATYNDLPLSSTTAPLNTAWLVRGSSGIWPFTKPGGVYARTATGGSSRDADYTYAGIFPDVFSDANFTLYDDGDTSKNLKFQLSSIPASTTRTVDAPLGSGRMLVEGQAIGSTTASTGAFSTLSASTSLTLGTSGILSGGTNTIEQRNTTSGQTFRIYNTVSGAADANYERGFISWVSNTLRIGTEKAGTGSARALEFSVDGTIALALSAAGNATIPASGALIYSARGNVSFTADGVLRIANASVNNFDRLAFGGTTSSFPALKRSSTTLQVRLADDSAFAPLSCGALTLNGNLDASTRDIVTDTTTGTKIGTGTTQKLGFFNATPVIQQAAVADATDAATVITQLNALLSRIRTLGLIAT